MSDATQRLLKKRLLKTTDMAKILNMKVRSIRQMAQRNEIPFIRVNRWHIRFDPDAIEAWLKKRTGIPPQKRKIWEGRQKASAKRQSKTINKTR